MPRVSAAALKPLAALTKSIVSIPTGSFNERHVHAALAAFAAERGLTYREDAHGNGLIEYRRGRATRPLVLGAHTDHPGFVVTEVRGKRLMLEFRGGVSAEYGRGEPLRLYDAGGRETGVARITSIATSTAPNRWARRLTGAHATLVEGAASPGDLALWDVPACRIRGALVEARQCDDLIGVVSILWTLDMLVRDRVDAHVIGLFTRAEEVGLVGAAAVAASDVLPKDALVVAVECSSAAGGRAEQGGGPVIRVGDIGHIFSPRMSMWMTQVAREMQAADPAFRFQRKLMDGGTTEATAYDLMGYETGAACVALGNYHNMGEAKRIAPETVHLGDIDGLARLFVGMAQNTRRIDEVHRAAQTRWAGIGKDAASRLAVGR